MDVGPQILFIDTENAPNLAAVWGIHEQRLRYEDIFQHWFMLSVQWSWNDSKKINSESLLDYRGALKRRDDKPLIKKIHSLIEEADIVVGHHVNGHDMKKIQARIIKHGLKPVKMPLIVDTLTWARKFGFTSRKLGDLCDYLDLSKKKSHEAGIFLQAALGDESALAKVIKYGIGDIPTLRDLYYRLRPYAPNHPNNNLFRGDGIECCPSCGNMDFQQRGYSLTSVGKFPRFQCKGCGKWFRGKKAVKRVNMR